MARKKTSNLIKEAALRQRIEELYDVENELAGVLVVGTEGGWTLETVIRDIRRVLANARGEVRLFATLDTAAKFLASMGFTEFDVDMEKYKPGRLRAARPLRSVAMARVHAEIKKRNEEAGE